MELTRRDFLKLGTVAAPGILILDPLKVQKVLAAGPAGYLAKRRVAEKTSICAYCAGGCGIVVGGERDNLISIEGDPDHPINQGALCSKAQALFQVRTVDGRVNPRRVGRVLYRAPNSTAWVEKSWDWALAEIAKRAKQTRDTAWIARDSTGVTVNRTEAIAQVGGSAHDNEECYVINKLNRALGLVYTETQARI